MYIRININTFIYSMSAGKLQDKLDSGSKVLWSARSVKEQVVLMDWNTKDSNPASSSPIGKLLEILQNVSLHKYYTFAKMLKL